MPRFSDAFVDCGDVAEQFELLDERYTCSRSVDLPIAPASSISLNIPAVSMETDLVWEVNPNPLCFTIVDGPRATAPPVTADQAPAPELNQGLSVGAIAGVVVGAVAGIVCGFLLYLKKYHRNGQEEKKPDPEATTPQDPTAENESVENIPATEEPQPSVLTNETDRDNDNPQTTELGEAFGPEFKDQARFVQSPSEATGRTKREKDDPRSAADIPIASATPVEDTSSIVPHLPGLQGRFRPDP